jgi:hypothetical protein
MCKVLLQTAKQWLHMQHVSVSSPRLAYKWLTSDSTGRSNTIAGQNFDEEPPFSQTGPDSSCCHLYAGQNERADR